MNGYLGYIAGQGMNLIMQMAARVDERRKEQRLVDAGVSDINGFKGVEQLNIPHIYYSIEIVNSYFYCRLGGINTVYNLEGKLLFDCTHVEYYKQGMFLVGDLPESSKNGEFGYALYNEDNKLTEPIFRTHGMSDKFNKSGFCILNIFGKSGSCIVNKLGEILLEHDSCFDSPYLHNAICSTKKGYINLLNGNLICEKESGYDSKVTSDEFLFVKVEENCVYQINKNTGDFIIHGERKPVIEPKKYEQPIIKKTEPSPPKQSRNEICACGSGKKFKHCCIGKNN